MFARNSILDREFYILNPEHLAAQSPINNQGRGAKLTDAESARVLEILQGDCDRAYDHYLAMAAEAGPDGEAKQGLARELTAMPSMRSASMRKRYTRSSPIRCRPPMPHSKITA